MFQLTAYDDDHTNQDVIESLNSIPPGARVGLYIRNGLNLSHSIIACWKAELICIPINPSSTPSQLDRILSHSRANYLIDLNGHRITQIEDYPIEYNFKDTGFIIYTSGSTGNQKGAVVSREAAIDNAKSVGMLHGFHNSRHATCLPMYHCNAIMMSLLGCFLYDSPLLIQAYPNMKSYLKSVSKFGAKTASIAPPLLTKLLSEYKGSLPDCLEYFISASSALKQNTAKAFYDRFGDCIVQGYGLTEAVNFSFTMPRLKRSEFKKQYIDNFAPIGIPIPGTEYYIAEDGELYVSGQNNMTEYLHDELRTKMIFSGKWLKTGDLAYERDGYVVLKGRKKEIINRGGETLCPLDIEEHLIEIGLPSFTYAHSIEDNLLGEELGLSINSDCDVSDVFNCLDKAKFNYGGISFNNGYFTSTGKPQRSKMSKGLFSKVEIEFNYLELASYCKSIAREFLSSRIEKYTPDNRSSYIYRESQKIVNSKHIKFGDINSNKNDIGFQFAKIVLENKDAIFKQKPAYEILKDTESCFWENLMCDEPMGSYSQFAADYLLKNDLLNGSVLEVGSGVGNLSRLIHRHIKSTYIRTDVSPVLLKKFTYSPTQYVYDFMKPGEWKGIDTIVGVNALHCAEDKSVAIKNLYNMLKDGGTLVLSEGLPYTKEGSPWALNFAFGIFRGWYNIGGFIKRSEWLSIMKEAGFASFGALKLRDGSHDLGGLIWAKK